MKLRFVLSVLPTRHSLPPPLTPPPLQPFSRMFDPSTASPTGTVLFHNGMPYTYQNGMAVFPPQEYAGQPQYPVMYSQPVIVPQQNFQYQTVGTATGGEGGGVR